MSATWQPRYEATVEGRHVRVHSREGSTFLKVLTIQVQHEEGIAYQDGRHFVHVSPSDSGEHVESEVASVEDLRDALGQLHFSEQAIGSIVDGVNAGSTPAR